MARQKITLADHIGEVDTFTDQIRDELSQTNTAWWRIAELISQATDTFKLSSEPMQELLRRVEIKKSKASKLNAIAKSERLKAHKDRLNNVPSWTVLYEVARLEDDAFERLLSEVSDNETITVARIDEVRGKGAKPKPSEKLIFQITVDRDAAVTGAFVENDYAEALKRLENVLQDYPYLRLNDISPYHKYPQTNDDSADEGVARNAKIQSAFKR